MLSKSLVRSNKLLPCVTDVPQDKDKDFKHKANGQSWIKECDCVLGCSWLNLTEQFS